MKKVLLTALLSLAALFFVGNQSAQAQRIYFCEDVDADGEPVNDATTFNISSSGGWLNILVHNNKPFNTSKAIIDIYRNGSYDNTINVSIEPQWDYFYQQVTFYKSGSYDIYVYDGNQKRISSKSLTIKIK